MACESLQGLCIVGGWIENLQFIGLLYDAFGIAVLGIPAMWRMTTEIAAQSNVTWDYGSYLVRELSISRLDTTVGSCLLIFGFTIQLAGAIGFRADCFWGVVLVSLLVLFVTAYAHWGRRRLTDRLHQTVQRRLQQSIPKTREGK